MQEQAVIIGAGHAGVALASSLREQGFDGSIRLVGAEAHLPYQRPPLSKEFMLSADEPPKPLRSGGFYCDNAIDLQLGETVDRIDLGRRKVVLGGGASLRYSCLAIATGGRPRRLPGTDIKGVHYLRGLDDAQSIRQQIAEEGRVVIVGGGFIGLELAGTLSALGHKVLVIEGASRLMARAVSPVVSKHFHRVHEASGVEFLLDDRPERFVSSGGRLDAIVTASGRRIPAAVAIVGVGLAPDIRLAEAAGLQCHDGIEVDECMIAGIDRVAAVGDCARFPQYHTGTRVRVESVQNATDQARSAAAALIGRRERYTAVPWFWSSQGSERLQIAGLALDPDREVVRGDPDAGRFSVFRYRGKRLLAVDSVNRPAEHMAARKLMAKGTSPDPLAVGDPDADLKSLVSA